MKEWHKVVVTTVLTFVVVMFCAFTAVWCSSRKEQLRNQRLHNIVERLDKDMDAVKVRLDSCRCNDAKR